MRHRIVASIGLAVAVALVPLLGTLAFAQARAEKRWTPPRTSDGRPDLQGVWSFANVTPFERPDELAGTTVLTDEDVERLEAEAAERANADDTRKHGTAADLARAYNDFWYDRGTRVASTRQPSIVVDPPNGRIPPLTPEGRARADERAAARKLRGPADDPEDRGLAERCIVGFNAGPPFTPSAYNNHIQIVQTRDYVMIMTEMVHDARIVPLDGRPHAPSSIQRWFGDSRGRWEGDTLVVETTNFSEKNPYRGSTHNRRLVERFWRSDEGILMYEFTVDDPATWTRPWTGRIPLDQSDAPIYEYACHEGNYGMEGIMKGTRAEERAAAQEKK